MRTLLVLLLVLTGTVFAEEPPGMIAEGFDYYYRYGTKSAIDTWLRGSSMDPNPLSDSLARLEQGYGKMIGFEKIRVATVCPSYLKYYVMVKYEKGAGFLTFDCYRPDKLWTVVWVAVDSAPPDRVVP